jgi:hypothetical protein
MGHCDFDKVCSGAAPGRAEVLAAIDGLIEEVANLALRVNRAVAMAHAVKAELPEKSISNGAARPATETVDQREILAKAAASACNAQTVEMVESVNIPLSPQKDSCSDNVGRNEPDLICDLSAKLEAAFPQPHHENCPEENTVAARVAELRERLGGFIKP